MKRRRTAKDKALASIRMHLFESPVPWRAEPTWEYRVLQFLRRLGEGWKAFGEDAGLPLEDLFPFMRGLVHSLPHRAVVAAGAKVPQRDLETVYEAWCIRRMADFRKHKMEIVLGPAAPAVDSSPGPVEPSPWRPDLSHRSRSIDGAINGHALS